ncbi:MAG: carboxypeptidase-like regulatory domain-containing protein [Candidatus Muiribacteriota bacterium]
MGIEGIITIGIAAAIILIALFFVLSFFHSYKPEVKCATGKIVGFIKTRNKSDSENIKITLAKVRSDTKFSYKAVKGPQGQFYITYTDRDGGFLFNDAPAGSFWLVIEKEGFKTMLKMIKVAENKTTEVTDITLK